MRATEMLTAAAGGAAGTTPSTASVAGLAGAGGGVPAAGAGGNFPLGAALLAFAFANFVNVLSIWLKEKKWDARKFLTSSGVISSLSAAVASLAVAVGQQEGGDSSVFALALVFAAVLMAVAENCKTLTRWLFLPWL